MLGIVPIQLFGKKGFECQAQETQCSYTRECTNHMSAGDYRMDFGMQPLLPFVDAEKKFLTCETKDCPAAEKQDQWTIVPSICLGYGEMLTLEDVNTQQLTLL